MVVQYNFLKKRHYLRPPVFNVISGSQELARGLGVYQVPHIEGGTLVRFYHPP